MNVPAAFAAAAKPSTADTCVRWNPNTRRYELVVGGKVLASISRLGMSMRSESARFKAKVEATAQMVRLVKAKREVA